MSTEIITLKEGKIKLPKNKFSNKELTGKIAITPAAERILRELAVATHISITQIASKIIVQAKENGLIEFVEVP